MIRFTIFCLIFQKGKFSLFSFDFSKHHFADE